MYQHILGSQLARSAVRHGLALAKAAGAKVTALTVEPSFDVYTVPASRVYEMSGAFAAHTERVKAHARGVLDAIAEEARAAGIVCETVQVEQDQPYQGIIDVAAQRGCRSHRHGLTRQERAHGDRARQRDHEGAHAYQNSVLVCH